MSITVILIGFFYENLKIESNFDLIRNKPNINLEDHKIGEVFQYTMIDERDLHSLPYYLLDLFRMYKFFSRFKPIIITDIEPFYPNSLPSMVVDGEIDSEALGFLSDKDSYVIVKDKESLLSTIARLRTDKTVVYFTGHGIEGSLVAPDGRFVERELLGGEQTIFILDCCDNCTMKLGYKFDERLNEFSKIPEPAILSKISQSSSESILSKGFISLVPENYLVITSNMRDKKVITTKKGSLFTSDLITYLERARKDKRYKIRSLIEEVRSVEVYSSRKMIPLFPIWFISEINIDVRIKEGILVAL